MPSHPTGLKIDCVDGSGVCSLGLVAKSDNQGMDRKGPEHDDSDGPFSNPESYSAGDLHAGMACGVRVAIYRAAHSPAVLAFGAVSLKYFGDRGSIRPGALLVVSSLIIEGRRAFREELGVTAKSQAVPSALVSRPLIRNQHGL